MLDGKQDNHLKLGDHLFSIPHSDTFAIAIELKAVIIQSCFLFLPVTTLVIIGNIINIPISPGINYLDLVKQRAMIGTLKSHRDN